MTFTITATPHTDASPLPRIVVLLDGLDVGVAFLTLFRQAEGRTFKVRGAVNVPVAGAFSIQDVEAPFQVESTYRAQLFDVDGNDLGFTVTAAATLDVDDCWIHNPLDPSGAIQIDIADTSAKSLTRETPGDVFWPEGRALAVLVSQRRRGLAGVDLFFSSDDQATVDKFEALFGGYDDSPQMVPILCVRTPAFLDIPRTFFASILAPARKPINVHMGGTMREWDTQADEASPPAPGLIIPLLSRDDIDAFFATRDDLDAAYGQRSDIDRDYAKAGGP